MMIRRIRNQFFKELQQFQRDRLGVALAFILPAIALLIIGFAIRLTARAVGETVRDVGSCCSGASVVQPRKARIPIYCARKLRGNSGYFSTTANCDRLGAGKRTGYYFATICF